MFNSISNNIITFLITNGYISKEDKELYDYGLRQFLMMLLNIVIMVILGLLLKELWQSILFSVVYIPLRSFAGGFHASTPQRCTVISTGMIFVALLIMKFIPISIFEIILMIIISSTVITFLSPVQNSNKPLDKLERIVYKRKTIIILIIEVLITILTLLFKLIDISYCISLSLVALSIMLMLGKMKDSLSKKAEI